MFFWSKTCISATMAITAELLAAKQRLSRTRDALLNSGVTPHQTTKAIQVGRYQLQFKTLAKGFATLEGKVLSKRYFRAMVHVILLAAQEQGKITGLQFFPNTGGASLFSFTITASEV